MMVGTAALKSPTVGSVVEFGAFAMKRKSPIAHVRES